MVISNLSCVQRAENALIECKIFFSKILNKIASLFCCVKGEWISLKNLKDHKWTVVKNPSCKGPAVIRVKDIAKQHIHSTESKEPTKPTKKEEDRDCGICLDPLKDRVSKNLSCKHAFHAECLKEFVNHSLQVGKKAVDEVTCPLCRGGLSEKEVRILGNFDEKTDADSFNRYREVANSAKGVLAQFDVVAEKCRVGGVEPEKDLLDLRDELKEMVGEDFMPDEMDIDYYTKERRKTIDQLQLKSELLSLKTQMLTIDATINILGK